MELRMASKDHHVGKLVVLEQKRRYVLVQA